MGYRDTDKYRLIQRDTQRSTGILINFGGYGDTIMGDIGIHTVQGDTGIQYKKIDGYKT